MLKPPKYPTSKVVIFHTSDNTIPFTIVVLDYSSFCLPHHTYNQMRYVVVHGKYVPPLFPTYLERRINFKRRHKSWFSICLGRTIRYVSNIMMCISICVSIHFPQYVAVGPMNSNVNPFFRFPILLYTSDDTLLSYCNEIGVTIRSCPQV